MLLLLTGEVQTGKTRWLEGLVAELGEVGVPVAGVLAPGQWVASSGECADEQGFEKLGIDNVLLPAGERLPFACRRDIARVEGVYKAESQAGRAELGWHIADGAIAQVNAHFERLEAEASGAKARGGLLVVDELGRLEIRRGEGLTSALRLLRRGPASGFPCALVVVRDYLADEAEALLSPAWGAAVRIGPDEAGRRAVLGEMVPYGNGRSA